MRKFFLLLVGSLFFLTRFELLKLPLVWPDEAVFADVASNLLKEGRMGTDLWRGFVPGVEQDYLWTPPLFFYTLAIWGKVFGFGVESLRWLSSIAGFGVVVWVLLIGQQIGKGKFKWWQYAVPTLFVFDVYFLQATRLVRPEIFVLFWGLGSAYFFLSEKFFLSGLFAGLALANHIAAVYFLIPGAASLIRRKELRRYIGGSLLVVSVWGMWLVPRLSVFIPQVELAFARKFADTTYISLIMAGATWDVKILIGVHVAVFILSLILFMKLGFRKRLYLFLIIIFAWVLAFFGRMQWYLVYPLVSTYLVLLCLIKSQRTKWLRRGGVLSMGFLIIINLFIVYGVVRDFGKKSDFSYLKLTEKVLSAIPDDKTVFVSAIPDVYFSFKETGRSNKLYEFPALQINRGSYLRALDSSDYVIYTGVFDKEVVWDLLPQYLRKNALRMMSIDEPKQYSMKIFELVPRRVRVKLE